MIRTALALDLEGSIISNAMSQIPRCHLLSFFRFCLSEFDHIVWFTAVRKSRALEVVKRLVSDGFLPPDALDVQYTDWPVNPEYQGEVDGLFTGQCYKDLSYVQEMFPEVPIEHIFIVDDDIQWISPQQRQQWVEVEMWETPYPEDDVLLHAASVLLEKKAFRERAG